MPKIQTACHVNAGCPEMGLKILGFMTSLTHVSQTSEIGVHVYHKAPVT